MSRPEEDSQVPRSDLERLIDSMRAHMYAMDQALQVLESQVQDFHGRRKALEYAEQKKGKCPECGSDKVNDISTMHTTEAQCTVCLCRWGEDVSE